MAAKGVQPVARRPEETSLFAVVVAGDGAGVLSNVPCLEIGIVVKNCRIKSAVIIGVCLDEKAVGENAAAVAEEQAEKIVRLAAAVFQGSEEHTSELQSPCNL